MDQKRNAMLNAQKPSRSGASQSSTISPNPNGDDYAGPTPSRPQRHTGTSGTDPDQPEHTAGGTSSPQPRQIDRQ